MMSTTTSTLLGRGKPANVSQLTDQLRLAVVSGVFEPGAQLPTIRQLSDETGLATNVISRAFSNLQAEGLLVSRKRAGTFVRSSVGDAEESVGRTRMRVFALIGPELTNGFYPQLQRGFDLGASQRGFQIITSNTDNDVRYQADTILQLIDKSVSGIALVPATLGPSPAHQIRLLQRNRIPVVLLHRGIEGVSAPLLRIPAEEVGRLAAKRLIAAGHRRLAFCAGQRVGDSALGYERGFRLALDAAGLELADDCVYYGNQMRFDNAAYVALEHHYNAWFDTIATRADRPTAMFTSFETIGEIAYLAALRHGLQLPRDLAIVTVGGIHRTGAIARRLACVTLDEEKAGAFTSELLDEMCREKRRIDDDRSYGIDIGFDPAEMFPHTLS